MSYTGNHFDEVTFIQPSTQSAKAVDLSSMEELVNREDVLSAVVTVTAYTAAGEVIHQQLDLDNQSDIFKHIGIIAKGDLDNATDVYRRITNHTNIEVLASPTRLECFLGGVETVILTDK